MKSLKCAWRRITVCAMVSIAMAGCTTNQTGLPPTIRSVGSNFTVKCDQKIGHTYNMAAVNSGTQVKIYPKGRIIYNRRYKNIQQGSYYGITYQVKWSDTLFYIAWITGNDYLDLARRNNIMKPYSLNVGQTLYVRTCTTSIPAKVQLTKLIVDYYKHNIHADKQSEEKMFTTTNGTVVTRTTTAPSALKDTGNTAIIGWRWPTNGKMIDNCSTAEGGNKGVDISGSRGQPILATASGRVVYTGNALRGYGNLIIIKHNDNYLSAYAHNDTLLVHEQQEVKVGQKISTMGSTGTIKTKLHFEIHYKGKSVNPLSYLPPR
ncbi:murein hydrolase activator NlpD [Candidatus Hoaglandella endobia]|uniref:Murein hydrolase activator NlpD n=1 Tax=Candidatus Hoaglandella endobia TaxID=1778263 RepID=A0A143WT97_9ENTR|nr:murein hydrolase activator NlpD [Candidatus Hoaglandella endobia]CUX97059.1 Murein hydrolase activator NlpD precursor [Candidatus Hoaglandella endobia]